MTYQTIVSDGVEDAVRYWLGFNHIWNNAVEHLPDNKGGVRPHLKNPMEFYPTGKNYRSTLKLTTTPSKEELFILEETLKYSGKEDLIRRSDGSVIRMKKVKEKEEEDTTNKTLKSKEEYTKISCREDQSLISVSSFSDLVAYSHLPTVRSEIENWQFVNFDPWLMGQAKPRRSVMKTDIQLHSSGSNLSEYLLDIYSKDQNAFDDILESLQYVLPYVNDLQPTQTSSRDIQSRVYLQLTEGKSKIPGWLFSTGTLRIIALLAILKHPTPPPLVVIEEIENGLDPRTVNLLVGEIRNAISMGKTQVIMTTHSPYLLDLLDLSHIVLVERNSKGEPQFTRPADREELSVWAEKFNPGQLYTMGKLS